MSKKLTLWYDRPAQPQIWNEALPIGNGSLGGMIYGGVECEHIQLNEETVWYGAQKDRNNPDALKYLPKIRQLLFDGEIGKAENLTGLAMCGTPFSEGHYEPLADLFVEFYHQGQPEGYCRELDIDHAVADVRYSIDGTQYDREIFASADRHAVFVRLYANKPGKLTCSVRLCRQNCYDAMARTHRISYSNVFIRMDLKRFSWQLKKLLQELTNLKTLRRQQYQVSPMRRENTGFTLPFWAFILSRL